MKAYPEYKNSGVEWLGEVPSHWSVPKISYLMNYLGSGTTPKSTNEEYYSGSTLWVTTGELREGIILDTKKKVSKLAIQDNSALKSHPVNSIVMAMYGATIGRLAKLGVKATTNQACCVLPPSEKIDTDFLYYWLMCHREEIIELGYGGGQPNISQDTVANLKVSLPSSYEQSKIVDFLDIKIGHVDNLIAEKQNFIKLLSEKRQALISHVVTKGLNSSLVMKDSGVEWIGEIPEHWECVRNKFIFELFSGYAFKSEYFEKNAGDDNVLITPGTFNELGELYFSKKNKISYKGEILDRFKLFSDDLVMVLTDLSYKKLILGRAAFVKGDSYLLNQRIAKVITKNNFDRKFLWYYLNSDVFRDQVILTASGATVYHTSNDKVSNAWNVIPSIHEQEEIAQYLDGKSRKYEKIHNEVIKSIELLKEHRTALISAAVTGKIDVREMA